MVPESVRVVVVVVTSILAAYRQLGPVRPTTFNAGLKREIQRQVGGYGEAQRKTLRETPQIQLPWLKNPSPACVSTPKGFV